MGQKAGARLVVQLLRPLRHDGLGDHHQRAARRRGLLRNPIRARLRTACDLARGVLDPYPHVLSPKSPTCWRLLQF